MSVALMRCINCAIFPAPAIAVLLPPPTVGVSSLVARRDPMTSQGGLTRCEEQAVANPIQYLFCL
jgi:hypothetical protein